MKKSDQDRIDGRVYAEEVLEDVSDTSEDFVLGFMRVFQKRLEKPKTPRPMTDDEAKAFGKRIVEFGKYRGLRNEEVPLNYWEWLADENRDVQRYLNSPRVLEERKAE